MTRPMCCSRPATPYYREYGSTQIYPSITGILGRWSWSFETGFRCKRCGQIRIPTHETWDSTYMDQLRSIREMGIEFDESLASR